MELDQLISYLINKEDSEGVVLLGHSTGCQVCVYCFQSFPFQRTYRSIVQFDTYNANFMNFFCPLSFV